MAQVPYQPEPRPLQDVNVQGPQVTTPPAAFGENIAEAAQKGGGEIWQRAMEIQNLQNETTARNQAIDTTQKMAKRFAQYNSLGDTDKNDAALNGLLTDLNDLRLQGRAGLNPMAARFYDAEAANLQNSFTRYGALESGRAVKAAAVDTARAHMDVISNTWANPDSDTEFDTKRKQMAAAARTEATNSQGGFSEDKVQDIYKKRISKLWNDRIDITMRTDIDKGFTLLNLARVNDEITPDDDKRVYDSLIAKNEQVGSRYIADTVYKSDKPMTQALEEGRKLAEGMDHGDPLFVGHVETAIRGKYGFDDAIIRRQINDDKNTIMQAVAKAASGPGLANSTELRTDPTVDAAVKRLELTDPTYAASLDDTIQKFYDYKHRRENDANYEKFTLWRYNDPLKFMQEDPNQYAMSNDQRNKILAARSAIAKDPNGDPRVTEAVKYIQDRRAGDLQALGILHPPKPGEYNPDYGKYLAALEGGIQSWTDAHKGQAPGYQDIVDVIAPQALSRVGTPHSFLGLQLGVTHPYEIPQDVLDKARKEVQKQNPDAQPTDDELRIGVYRKQFKDLFSKGNAGGGSTPTKPGSAGPI